MSYLQAVGGSGSAHGAKGGQRPRVSREVKTLLFLYKISQLKKILQLSKKTSPALDLAHESFCSPWYKHGTARLIICSEFVEGGDSEQWPGDGCHQSPSLAHATSLF